MKYDMLILNGKLIDGTGNPWFNADIGIKDGKITKLGHLVESRAPKILDVTDLVVAPGFIDIHSHSDYCIFFDPRGESTIRQGITTLVVGQCGETLAPVTTETVGFVKKLLDLYTPGIELNITWRSFGEYLEALDRIGSSANILSLCGFANIRIVAGPGYEAREPTIDELNHMKILAAKTMQEGAFGMSTGLVFTPQVYAKPEEVIEIAKVIAQYGGRYFCHIRGEGATVVQGVQEVIQTVDQSGCVCGHIAHHKISGKPYWGLSKETLHLMEEANERGLNITCDQYPYNRGLAGIFTLLPPWSHEGGLDQLVKRVQDSTVQDRIIKDVTEGIEGWENWIKDVGWDRLYIATVRKDKWKDVEGKSLAEITQLKRKANEWETLFELIVDENAEVSMTIQSMGEEDIRRIMTGRYTAVATDGWGVAPTGVLSHGEPHPRFYGTYPRVLGKYVREEGLLTLENAIRKMTSFPAQQIGLFDRGLLREGMCADVVVFDPNKVKDKATFERPHQFSEGIYHVIVNGQIVVENDQQTEKLPGHILRKSTLN